MKNITKSGKLDKRFKTTQSVNQWFNKYTASAAMVGLITGSLVGCYLADRPAQQQTKPISNNKIELVQVVEAKETPFCYDPITCIRDIGEQLGATNNDIMTMIRIAKCESGLRPEAVNINTNKTIDRGVFQINSIHKDLSNKDAFDFDKNIRFAWKMQQRQGFRPWVCYQKVKNS